MTMFTTDLDQKLVTKIINYSDSLADLAQFRLVCKSWNVITEPLMFSKPISISSPRATLALYSHLLKRPHYGKLIKHLHFDDGMSVPAIVLRGILELAFTPNMERITGKIGDDNFYLSMNNIANKASRDKFDKLKAIPHPPYYSGVYNVVLLNFESTLEEITYSLQDENGEDIGGSWSFFSKLESFVNLFKFELEANLYTVFDLEDTLAGCSRLKELTVKTNFCYGVHVKSEVEAWAPLHVKIVGTVRKLVILHECRSDLLEYLLFKYPNTDALEVDVVMPLITIRHNLLRTVNAIKSIRSYKVKLVAKSGDLIECLRFLIADGVRFRMEEDRATEHYCIKISCIS